MRVKSCIIKVNTRMQKASLNYYDVGLAGWSGICLKFQLLRRKKQENFEIKSLKAADLSSIARHYLFKSEIRTTTLDLS